MKKRPGIQKAIDFIMQGFATKSFGGTLPAIKSLAQAADVSFVTMWKAVDQLRHDGTLSKLADGRDGELRGEPSDESADKKPGADAYRGLDRAGSVSEKLLVRMRKDILTGKYSAGTALPSNKDLQFYYNVSYPSLRKVLGALSAQELIQPFRRGYTVPSLVKKGSTARIVAIGSGWEDGTLWIDHQDKNYFRILESECIQAKLALDIVVYCRKENTISFIDTITGKPYDFTNDSIISIIMIVANLEIPPTDVIRNLAKIKKPMAVLDVVGGWDTSARIPGHHYLQFFTVTMSSLPPRQTGQYLLERGHTTIAYFSPFHKAVWSRHRYEGIREVYKDAGLADGVLQFTLDDFAFQWDFLQEGHDNAEDVKALVAAYNKWKNSVDSEFFRKFGNISYNISKYLTEWNCATGEIFHRLLPLFKKALKNKAITAWVMANDYTATLALDFLKERKMRVPDDLSVISFDNTLDAMEYQLTSYDFNSKGIISMMLQYALRPSSVAHHVHKKVITTEGAIIERRTMANRTRQ